MELLLQRYLAQKKIRLYVCLLVTAYCLECKVAALFTAYESDSASVERRLRCDEMPAESGYRYLKIKNCTCSEVLVYLVWPYLTQTKEGLLVLKREAKRSSIFFLESLD